MEDVELFAFVPAALRHDFSRDDNDDAAAVDAARRTRSARVVASLLFDTRETKAPTKKRGKQRTSAAATPSPRPQATPPLYSLAVERELSKRMAFTTAVQGLDAYFDALRRNVDALSSSGNDAWLWDPATTLPTLLQLQRKVVQTLASCLPDCDVYLAMYEALPMATPAAATPRPLLRYAAASPLSEMAGRVLYREVDDSNNNNGSTPSFAVLDAMDPVLIHDVGASTSSSVQWLGRVDAQTVMTGPFACLPLVDARGARGIGVLALDACRKAAQLRPEAMSSQALFEFLVRMQLPEAATEFRKLQFGGRQFLQLTANDLQHRPAYRSLKIQTKQRVMEVAGALRNGLPLHLPRSQRPPLFSDDDDALALLDDVCERAGSFLDEYARRVHWHRVMAKRTNDIQTTVLDVYAALVQGIAQALPCVERVCVWKIRACADIDAIATTQLPDDRLVPFLQWSERQIRRVPLYIESSDDSGQLLQGNVTRIHLSPPPPQSSSTPTQPCERALYHVSWSNRTQQSLSWPQLRLILPIRPMNARHYQLSQLLKRLQTESDKSPKTTIEDGSLFRLTDPHALVVVLKDPHRPGDIVYALQVDIRPQPPVSDGALKVDEVDQAEQFLQRAVAITQQNLACVRGREKRALRRQLSTAKTSRNFSSFGLTPSAEALRALDEIVAFVFSEITENLPETQQRIAEVLADGAQLRYTFASNGSTLVGKSLSRGQGVSFRCIDTRSPLVVDHKSELRSRMKRLGSRDADVEAELPYVFIPLLYEDTCVGVLSINRFTSVPIGREDESHPENGVVEYLVSLAKTLAAAIYLKRRAFALHTLQQLRTEPLRSPEQLFFATSRILQDTMIGVWKMRFVEIDFVRGKSTTVYEYSEAARQHAESVLARQVVPLGYRERELLPDTIAHHWEIPLEEVNDLLQLWQKYAREVETERATMVSFKAQNEMERRKIWEWKVRRRYYQIELRALENDPDNEKDGGPSSSSAFQASTRVPNHKYLIQALSTSLGTKALTFAGIEALNIGATSALFVTVATQPQFFATCEQNFVDRMAETLSRMMEALAHRIERSRKRVDALGQLELKCSSFVDTVNDALSRKPSKVGGFPLSANDEIRTERLTDLLDGVVRYVGSVLECPCVYAALQEPFHRRLHYVASSPASSMTDKILHRGHGVSFHALDQRHTIVVTSATEELAQASKLRYFSSEPESQKWPFIVVPIDTVGVLTLDNLEKLAQLTGVPQPEFGLVDFLRRAARIVGSAIASVRSLTRAHRQHRREDAVVRVMSACEDRSKRTTALYLQHIVLQAVESAFNGVDAYIGMVQPLCSSILFTSATERSGMASQRLNSLDTVSFRVFLSQRQLVIPQVERKQFDASETAAAQEIRQLRWFTPSQDHGRKGPFVCIPIPFVGVLSVDTFPGAASGIYSPHVPEHGVVECLTTMANHFGHSIREMTAVDTLRQLPTLFEGNKSTFRVVFRKVLELIAKNVLTAVELCVVCFDAASWVPVHGSTAPLVALASSIHEPSHLTIADLGSSILNALRSSGDLDPRCFCLQDDPEVIILRCHDIRDVDSAGQDEIDWQRSCRSLATGIIIRRVQGVTWSYDEEFVSSLAPCIDEIVQLVNTRVSGIVSRKNAMHTLEAMCAELESSSSSLTAFQAIPRFAHDFLNIVTRASSQIPGDSYLGERTVGCDALEFIAASEGSLMKGVKIDLLSPENLDLVSISCLDHGRHIVVYSVDSKNDHVVRSLTSKKPERLFAAFPLSEDRILCIDSLSIEAFDPVRSQLEKDVESFLLECASLLESTISAVRYRYAYDQLCNLKSRRHKNFRDYFATIHTILRRELTVVHSQQILELADDFTGHFSVSSWHRSATRRPIRGSIPPHLCFLNGCTRELISDEIHFDQHIALPMTNVPRTLDHSRAAMEPAFGTEKQGAYACECLATMLDTGFKAAPKLALCAYTHDSSSGGKRKGCSLSVARPTSFTTRQHQFFFAVAAVAADVYTHVFRSCVLETFGAEFLFIARDRLNAKDAVLLAVDASGGGPDKQVRVEAGFAAKWVPGAPMSGKLAEKVLVFHDDSNVNKVDFVMFVSKTTSASRARSSVQTAQSMPPASASNTSPGPIVPVKRSFFKRPRLFGAKDKAPKTPTNAAPVAIEMAPPPPPPTTEFHILVRGHHHGEIISLYVEREVIASHDLKELIASEVRCLMEELSARRSSFLKAPHGDEEWNGAGFGHVPEIGEGGGFGGGGFHVLSCWTLWRDTLRDQIIHFETDMRSYLTGVQATSREQVGALVAASVRPGLLPTAKPHFSIFSHEDPPRRAAAIALVRAALCLCGFKKEVVLESPTEKDDDLLKEYLRTSAGRKLLDLNPRTTAKWAVVVRASNYIRTKFNTLARLGTLDGGADADAVQAARMMLAFVSAISSAVKYFKFLQDAAKQRKQRVDAFAIRIQCMCRAAFARKELRRLKTEFAAAVAIQCAFRQHLARRRRAFLKWDRAARTVQKAYRRRVALRRGRRPRKLTLELRSVAAQYGTMQAARLGNALDTADSSDDAWKVEMAAFDSFKSFLESRVGREQLKREEHVITERLKEVARQREQTLTVHDRLLADAYDVFELLDIDGSGELSRERTQELMTRLHIPLSGEEAADVIDMMDNDRSGAISFGEFTSWFAHEFDVLKKRNRECGVLSKRDRQWITEESARSAVRKRWRAHHAGGSASPAAPRLAERAETRSTDEDTGNPTPTAIKDAS